MTIWLADVYEQASTECLSKHTKTTTTGGLKGTSNKIAVQFHKALETQSIVPKTV